MTELVAKSMVAPKLAVRFAGVAMVEAVGCLDIVRLARAVLFVARSATKVVRVESLYCREAEQCRSCPHCREAEQCRNYPNFQGAVRRLSCPNFQLAACVWQSVLPGFSAPNFQIARLNLAVEPARR